MVPPDDGARSNRLPTMSWDSVVDDGGADAPLADTPSAPTAPLGAPPVPGPAQVLSPFDATPSAANPPASAPLTQPTPVDSPVEPIVFAPFTLSGFDQPPESPAPVPAVVATAPDVVAPLFDHGVRFAPIDPIVAPLGDAVAAAEAPAGLPPIVEATPVPDGDPLAGLDLMATPSPTGPRLPQVEQLEGRRVAAAAVAYEASAPVAAKATKKKRRTRGGFKLVLVLLVLGGLVAAGVVVGRPYLFPGDWDATTEPYAVAVEAARSVDFVEPLTVTAEPTAEYTARLAAQLAGNWSEDEALWRSLGLLSGPVTQESVSGVLQGWQDALYSFEDGQIYRDAGIVGPQLDAETIEAMTAASLDQEFAWSNEQPNRTLDDAALTLAELDRQSRAVLDATSYATAIEPINTTAAAQLPPVIGYRVLAPQYFVEFQNANVTPDNALLRIEAGGPGPIAAEAPAAAPGPTLLAGDVVTTSPRALDRSFWFLVFGGALDSATSFQASEAIVENAVTIADRGGAKCVYATFAGGALEQTATLRGALESWAAAAPVESVPNFSVLDDGTLQLVSCDPGVGYQFANRAGVAGELLGWRMAELATIEAMNDTNGTAADFDAAWALVQWFDVGTELGSLPSDMPPAEAAAAARAAVGAALASAG